MLFVIPGYEHLSGWLVSKGVMQFVVHTDPSFPCPIVSFCLLLFPCQNIAFVPCNVRGASCTRSRDDVDDEDLLTSETSGLDI